VSLLGRADLCRSVFSCVNKEQYNCSRLACHRNAHKATAWSAAVQLIARTVEDLPPKNEVSSCLCMGHIHTYSGPPNVVLGNTLARNKG
jgi:hypothetical protein